MKYISRELERKFMQMNGFFKAVLVTGGAIYHAEACFMGRTAEEQR